MATLKDVAREAGVSPAAVSRHLNGRITFPQKTRERIDAAIERLAYHPNLTARRLSLGRTRVIGVVLPDIANPFFSEMVAEIERSGSAQGYDISIWSTRGDPRREEAAAGRLREAHVDGLIFASAGADPVALRRTLTGLDRVVLLDEDIPGTALPKVMVENMTGAAAAAEHLLTLGHREIAIIAGPAGSSTVSDRIAGFQTALLAAGLGPAPVHYADFQREAGRRAAEALLALPRRPTAIFACSDELAIGAIVAARAMQLEVPRDLSLVGFDDISYASVLGPALTTVRQPLAQMGQTAVDRLLSLLAGTSPPLLTRLKTSLVVRDTTAPPRRA
ncbi:LacI family DNA-binding transcriptional regulator [Pseudoroseicyclus aestuarii]|uniref:LacI family transcriptional regulator n=1 Tax=Pseudoroseicyclus aestuarii TaxID=1795041 RepID=A0A318SVB7_9RHOB|nr:LacI family DNA-binding transcriptional regulator [Pseudoroseicyclus aestuarii]PYE85365.1 LacI family transcriptional regulator [Pseudoroseicyclus aestuarii]